MPEPALVPMSGLRPSPDLVKARLPAFLLPVAPLLLLAACERPPGEGAAEVPERADRHEIRPSPLATPPGGSSRPDGPAERKSAWARVGEIHQLENEELWGLLEAVLAEPDVVEKRDLMAEVHEETRLRPDFVRFPLNLEMARQADCEESLRATIMAELGRALDTDHGRSWVDWAMAIEEHAARTHGMIRVD